MPQKPPAPQTVDSLASLIATGKPPEGRNDWNGMNVFVADPNNLDTPKINVGGHEPHAAASLTKMMTFYETLKALKEKGINPNDSSILIPISVRAGDAERDNFVTAGEKLPLPDALGALMTASDNGAAVALSEWVQKTRGGNFLQDLNATAKNDLHLDGTAFYNVNGLPRHAEWKDHHVAVSKDRPDNTTTASDMAKMIVALHRDFPEATQEFMSRNSVRYGRATAPHQTPHHLLDPKMPEMNLPAGYGVIAKTGYTKDAGHNIATLVTGPDGKQLVVVVMGSGDANVAQAQALGVPDSRIPHPKSLKRDPGEAVLNGTLPRDSVVREIAGFELGGIPLAIAPPAAELAKATPDNAGKPVKVAGLNTRQAHTGANNAHHHSGKHHKRHAVMADAASPLPLSDDQKARLAEAQAQFSGALATGGSVGAPAGKQKDTTIQLG